LTETPTGAIPDIAFKKGGFAPPFLLSWLLSLGGVMGQSGNNPTPREAEVRASFDAQSFMTTLGAKLVDAGDGTTRIVYRHRKDLCQQHEFLHAGVATAIVDSACGYAALSMAPEGTDVLTIEFKTNFLRPASGAAFEALGRVVKPGSQIMVCEGEVWETEPKRRLIVTMTATMFIFSPGGEAQGG